MKFCLPAAHHLLCSPVPNRLRTSTRVWGPLNYRMLCFVWVLFWSCTYTILKSQIQPQDLAVVSSCASRDRGVSRVRASRGQGNTKREFPRPHAPFYSEHYLCLQEAYLKVWKLPLLWIKSKLLFLVSARSPAPACASGLSCFSPPKWPSLLHSHITSL